MSVHPRHHVKSGVQFQAQTGKREHHTSRQKVSDLVERHVGSMRADIARHPAVPPDQVEDWLHDFVLTLFPPADVFADAQKSGVDVRGHVRGLLRAFIEDRQQVPVQPEPAGLLTDHIVEAEPNPLAGYDPGWAQKLLDEMIGRTRKELIKKKRRDVWLILRSRLENVDEPVHFALIARRIGVKETAARNLFVTGKRALMRNFEDVVFNHVGRDGSARVAKGEFWDHIGTLALKSEEWSK